MYHFYKNDSEPKIFKKSEIYVVLWLRNGIHEGKILKT